jgi:hypothetical protein
MLTLDPRAAVRRRLCARKTRSATPTTAKPAPIISERSVGEIPVSLGDAQHSESLQPPGRCAFSTSHCTAAASVTNLRPPAAHLAAPGRGRGLFRCLPPKKRWRRLRSCYDSTSRGRTRTICRRPRGKLCATPRRSLRPRRHAAPSAHRYTRTTRTSAYRDSTPPPYIARPTHTWRSRRGEFRKGIYPIQKGCRKRGYNTRRLWLRSSCAASLHQRAPRRRTWARGGGRLQADATRRSPGSSLAQTYTACRSIPLSCTSFRYTALTWPRRRRTQRRLPSSRRRHRPTRRETAAACPRSTHAYSTPRARTLRPCTQQRPRLAKSLARHTETARRRTSDAPRSNLPSRTRLCRDVRPVRRVPPSAVTCAPRRTPPCRAPPPRTILGSIERPRMHRRRTLCRL